MSKARAKGTAAESMFVKFLIANGFPHAERRALSGGLDKGDTTGHPGLVFEVKDAKTWTVLEWLRETEQERVNAKADLGFLIVKVPGKGAGRVDQWYGFVARDDLSKLWAMGGCIGYSAHATTIRKKKYAEAIRTARASATNVAVGLYPESKIPFGVMELKDLFTLIRAAGYGTPKSQEGDS